MIRPQQHGRDIPPIRLLQVRCDDNGWGIANRAENLTLAFSRRVESQTLHLKEAAALDGHDFDVVHLHSLVYVPYLAAHQSPLVHHPAWGFEVPSHRCLSRAAKCPRVLRRARFCIAKNPALAVALRPCLDVAPVVIPNGVDTTLFRPPPIRVGWAGRKDSEARLAYKGVPVIRETVDRLAAAWALDGVTWSLELDPGRFPDGILSHAEMAAWYRTLDAFVCASRAEGCSNVCLEALACGVPVVTTAVGIAADMAEYAGAVVVGRTPGAIARGLERVLANRLTARRATVARWSWPLVAAEYEKLYRRLL
ncbi:MAG TPA: glycosyltransferase family 4 protein [Phycisphaerae bacterium]|nr:glycosyltransferase family 4 protein [Phycisphaerae bacterium]